MGEGTAVVWGDGAVRPAEAVLGAVGELGPGGAPANRMGCGKAGRPDDRDAAGAGSGAVRSNKSVSRISRLGIKWSPPLGLREPFIAEYCIFRFSPAPTRTRRPGTGAELEALIPQYSIFSANIYQEGKRRFS